MNSLFLSDLNTRDDSIELQEYNPLIEETDRHEIDEQINAHRPTVIDIHEVVAEDENPLHEQAKWSGYGVIIELDPSEKYPGQDKESVFFQKLHMEKINKEENLDNDELNLFQTKPEKRRIRSWPKYYQNDDGPEVEFGTFATKENAILTKLRSKLNRSRRFDAFVSFHHSGPHRDFVFNKIQPELEEKHDPPFRLYIHDRDFGLSEDIMWNIETAIKQSNSVIIVMSH